MNDNNLKIERFFKAFEDAYLTNKISFHLTKSSLETLKNVNMIIDSYFENETNDRGKMLLNIFGMLQALFVGVDALYGLSYGVTNKKWSVNVNNNPELREIKYVRNDVVGHPTKRLYSDNKIGYCDLDLDKTTYFELVYKIAIPSDNSEDITNHTVDLKKTINSYMLESSKVLDEIYKRMLLESNINNEYFSEYAYSLYKDYRVGVKNYELLQKIKEKYMKTFDLDGSSHDRFIWRINQLEELFRWDENEHNEILIYLIYYIIEKLYRMCNQIDDLDFSNIVLSYSVPKKVKDYVDFVHKYNIDETILNDNHHPNFLNLLDKMNELANKNRAILKINNMFIENKDNQMRIYLLGCMFNYEG
ncbi:MAG: hypothetical protein J6Y28_03785 [Acholeplasmatales bacterium]|nr:hypothetical protein [Acholeplasmatales bacterium]